MWRLISYTTNFRPTAHNLEMWNKPHPVFSPYTYSHFTLYHPTWEHLTDQSCVINYFAILRLIKMPYLDFLFTLPIVRCLLVFKKIDSFAFISIILQIKWWFDYNRFRQFPIVFVQYIRNQYISQRLSHFNRFWDVTKFSEWLFSCIAANIWIAVSPLFTKPPSNTVCLMVAWCSRTHFASLLSWFPICQTCSIMLLVDLKLFRTASLSCIRSVMWYCVLLSWLITLSLIVV